jgi:GxxExxY protein
MEIEKTFKTLLNCAFRVHSSLGPGLLENSYQECLFYELRKSGIEVSKQVPLPLVYEEVILEIGYRIDLMVEERIIVEVKSIDALAEIHMAQILTYMRLSGCRLGLLVNFNVKHLKDGIKRVIL